MGKRICQFILILSVVLGYEIAVAGSKAKKSVKADKKIVVIKMTPEKKKRKKSRLERAMAPNKKLNRTVGVHFGSVQAVSESEVEPLPKNLKTPVLPEIAAAKMTKKKVKRSVASTTPKPARLRPPEESMKAFQKHLEREIGEYDDIP